MRKHTRENWAFGIIVISGGEWSLHAAGRRLRPVKREPGIAYARVNGGPSLQARENSHPAGRFPLSVVSQNEGTELRRL